MSCTLDLDEDGYADLMAASRRRKAALASAAKNIRTLRAVVQELGFAHHEHGDPGAIQDALRESGLWLTRHDPEATHA